LISVFLEFPLSIIQRANCPIFNPFCNAVKMKGMIADSPSYVTFRSI